MEIFNIFSSNKKLRKEKPKIIVDTREKNSLVLSNLINECEIELKQLEIGDYLIGNTIIERKTFSDFISSMLSKRLLEQLIQMQKYQAKLLILEGKDFEQLEETKSRLNPNSIRGMLLSVPLEFNTGIIFTKNSEETAKYLILLAKRLLKNPQEASFHSKKPESKKERLEYILESFPNIGPKTAKLLLKKFKTIRNIINASESELEEQIGKKAEAFKLKEEKY